MLDMRTAGIFVFWLATYYFSSSVRFSINSSLAFFTIPDIHQHSLEELAVALKDSVPLRCM